MARRTLALTLCSLAALVFVLGLGAERPGPQFPQRIGELTLARLITRQQARQKLDSIHEERIAAASAAIAYYEGQGGGAVVWWSRSSGEQQAADQLARMVAKIRGGQHYPYSHYRELRRKGLTVHSFLGRGQVHYTYRKADQVYWISAPAALIDSVFDAVTE